MPGEYPITSKRLRLINHRKGTAREVELVEKVSHWVIQVLSQGGLAFVTFILLGGDPETYDKHTKAVKQPIQGSVLTNDLTILFNSHRSEIENIVGEYR